MIIRTLFSTDDNTITGEYEDGEEIPEEDDVIYLPGEDDNGFRVGKILYHKFNVKTYEVIEDGIEGSYDDPDLIGDD